MNGAAFETGLSFVVYILRFAPRVPSGREINLANLKHKRSIFVLVRLGILLPLESDHFPEKWLVWRRSACCGK